MIDLKNSAGAWVSDEIGGAGSHQSPIVAKSWVYLGRCAQKVEQSGLLQRDLVGHRLHEEGERHVRKHGGLAVRVLRQLQNGRVELRHGLQQRLAEEEKEEEKEEGQRAAPRNQRV